MSTITIIAHTTTTPEYAKVVERLGFEGEPKSGEYNPVQELPEFAGRNCYRSWSKPNPKTRHTEDYLKHILDVKHHSVLEHSSVTFFIEGVSRALLAELTRHRHFSFSVLSQRYHRIDGYVQPVVHPEFEGDEAAIGTLNDFFEHAKEVYGDLLLYFTTKIEKEGVTGTIARKRASQAARMVLPNATPTDIVITGNLRAWLDFLPKRDSDAADLEIAAEAKTLRELLNGVAPAVFPLDGE